MPRKKVHTDSAAKQRAYRARKAAADREAAKAAPPVPPSTTRDSKGRLPSLSDPVRPRKPGHPAYRQRHHSDPGANPQARDGSRLAEAFPMVDDDDPAAYGRGYSVVMPWDSPDGKERIRLGSRLSSRPEPGERALILADAVLLHVSLAVGSPTSLKRACRAIELNDPILEHAVRRLAAEPRTTLPARAVAAALAFMMDGWPFHMAGQQSYRDAWPKIRESAPTWWLDTITRNHVATALASVDRALVADAAAAEGEAEAEAAVAAARAEADET